MYSALVARGHCGVAAMVFGIGVAGDLLAPPVPVPAAPGTGCSQYGFSGPVTIRRTFDPGETVDLVFSATGQTVSGRASTQGTKNADATTGTVSGGMTGIRTIDITYDPDGQSNPIRYTGLVHEVTEIAGGDMGDGRSTWTTVGPLACLDAPAAKSQGMAEVTGDVDMYDQPGGSGGKYPGFLHGGQTVKLVTCRDDNWCNVIAPDGRSVWVWGDFIKH